MSTQSSSIFPLPLCNNEVTEKAAMRIELHPKSFMSNFWGAVQYDTASALLCNQLVSKP